MGVSGVLAQERREVRSSEGPRLEERVHIAGERERERVINKTKVRRSEGTRLEERASYSMS
jgi:hypothetical protein